MCSLPVLACLGLLGTISNGWAGTVYKCRNAQGGLIYQEQPCAREVESVSSWESKTVVQPDVDAQSAVAADFFVIKQQPNGSYALNGSINGRPLMFIVDTGASATALPRSFAYMAHMSCDDQMQMNTANGKTAVCISVIDKLEFGPFMMSQVPATIVPNLEQPLLGMNVLSQFRIEQENGEMRISVRR